MKQGQDQWKVKIFEWGSFALDGGAMFGIVPKVIWSKLTHPDADNRIPMSLRSLYLERGEQRVLVDLGMGAQWDEKLKKIYKLETSPLDMILQDKLGITTNDITHVVLTHLHFDHCGFLSQFNEANKKWESSFKNAEIFLLKENFENAINPNHREKASYIDYFWKDPLAKGQFKLLNANWLDTCEVLPGIQMRRVDGHTRGQAIIYIDGMDAPYLFMGDLCPTENHLKDVYVMGYDINAGLSVKEKQTILYEKNTLEHKIVFEHSATLPVSRLIQNEKGIVLAPQ